ncbi:UNVERIFIED_CONTAM: hypothetical protein FKN15_019378 [Acipenser sinensis]
MKQQEVFLALASLLPLVVILVKCICCWQKSKIIKEENTVYEEHFPEGQRFTVVRSKTVTRPNQMTRETPPSPARPASSSELRNGGDEQPKYENIVIGRGVDYPLANSRHTDVYISLTLVKPSHEDSLDSPPGL